jgi:hypothetical protein
MAELGMDAQFDRFQKLLIGDKLDIVRSPT